MRLGPPAAFLVCAGIGACSAGPIIESWPGSTLVASPGDGTTGLAALSIDLGLTSGPPAADTLQEIGRGTLLVTWPAIEPIETLTMPAEAGPFGDRGIVVRSAVAVDPGWYAAVLPPLPPRVGLDERAFHKLVDGRSSIRVRVGSAPALQSISVCPKGDKGTAVVVAFSESVRAATTSTITPLAVSAGAAASPGACAGEEPLADLSRSSYEVVCPNSLGPKDVVRVVVTTGLVSDARVDVPPFDRVAAVDTLTPDAVIPGCASLLLGP